MARRRIIGVVSQVVQRLAFVAVVCAVLLGLPAVREQPPAEVVVVSETPKPERPLEDVDIALQLFARVPRPTAMAYRLDDDALYVASKRGQVYRLADGRSEVVLDVSKELSLGFEQGLLGLAFTPDGTILVVNFTNTKDASVTRAYLFQDNKAVTSSGKDLLVVRKPAENHNAGNLAFGPDDYLYLSLGDGGLSGDPKGNAQSLKSVLGKIHRIEVLPDRTYRVPTGNPFVDSKKARPEIWAYGFRNPWRFSFDRQTGDLWISDVGRDTYEEISYQPAAAAGGRNYGWHYFEGPKKYKDARLKGRVKPKDHVLPVHWYKHNESVCAVSGGYVYRGADIDGLAGTYLYSDYCKGGIEGIRLDDASRPAKVAEERRWKLDVAQVSSFGQDRDGELYVLALTENKVYKLVPA